MRKDEDSGGGAKFVGAVENAITILRLLAHAGGPLGVASIARDTDLNVSTTFNILRTLAKEGLVVFDPSVKTYRLGLGVLEFSAPLLGADQADLIRPELHRLCTLHHALIGLWNVTPQDRIVLVERAVSPRVVRIDMQIGSRLPALIGAVGRCVAATRGLSRRELKRCFGELRWQDAPTFEDYWADVQRAGRDGWAMDRGQLFRGLDIVAAVVRDHGGDARFGISGIAIAGQLADRELVALAEAIRVTADRISSNLYTRALETVGRTAGGSKLPVTEGLANEAIHAT